MGTIIGVFFLFHVMGFEMRLIAGYSLRTALEKGSAPIMPM